MTADIESFMYRTLSGESITFLSQPLTGYISHHTLIFLEPDKYLVHQRHLPSGVACSDMAMPQTNAKGVKRDLSD